MWPSDQRLEGGMMTYRGRGHTQVKVSPLGNTNTDNSTAARQDHGDDCSCMATGKGNTTPKPKQKTMATTWQQSHRPGNSVGQQHYCNTAKLKPEKAMLRHIYIATSAWQQHSHQYEYGTATVQHITLKSVFTSQTLTLYILIFMSRFTVYSANKWR